MVSMPFTTSKNRLFINDEEGKPIAVLLPIAEYERLRQLAEANSEEMRQWLALSESSFSFWDNEKDAAYDAL
jgi:hypothetical protein